MTKELKNPTVFPQEYIDRMNEQLDELLGPKKQLTISDMKIGDVFLMDGIDVDGKRVKTEVKLLEIHESQSWFSMNRYIIESEGCRVWIHGDDKVYLK